MSDPNQNPQGRKVHVDLADLGDATLLNLRNEALLNGQKEFAAEVDREIEARAAPELYRHSRRRKR